ncbi:hypothetical protein [Sulfitobacter mediterraneus]|uniref:hypothetical protein n=1 Tax=Sulfitobacter mediterraneus TaxID=83219 RepID=UPI00193AA1A2|nr:hypothetical protein [Sulfitobacter mediterraneus]
MMLYVPILIAMVAGFLLAQMIDRPTSNGQNHAVPYIEEFDKFVIAVARNEPYIACIEFGESPLFGLGLKGNEMALSLEYDGGGKDKTIFLLESMRTRNGVSTVKVALDGKDICETREAGETFLVTTGSPDSDHYNSLIVQEGF